jgi:hypothetical protein
MKIMMIMMCAATVAGCAKDVSTDIKVISEKPFVAAPTNQAMYDDCKRTIDLYEKKLSTYVMTSCYAEIRGIIASAYIAQHSNILSCKDKNKKINNPDEPIGVVIVRTFLNQYEKSRIRTADAYSDFGILPYLRDYLENECKGNN